MPMYWHILIIKIKYTKTRKYANVLAYFNKKYAKEIKISSIRERNRGKWLKE
jgi:hypothetical protein